MQTSNCRVATQQKVKNCAFLFTESVVKDDSLGEESNQFLSGLVGFKGVKKHKDKGKYGNLSPVCPLLILHVKRAAKFVLLKGL